MAYLGTLGRLVELRGINSQQVEAEDRYTFQTTLEGRTKAQVRPIGRRKWELGTKDTARAEDLAAIMSFANGEWGPGPFVFVSADAPFVNMLSPDAASCAADELYSGGAVGGPMDLGNGEWAGRSYLNPGATSVFFGKDETPVIPGKTITASAYLLGAGAVARVTWYDFEGKSMFTASSSVVGKVGEVVRSWVTTTPPTGARGARVSVSSQTAQAARPALTWTPELRKWADGQGCPKAVLHGASRSLTATHRDPRGLQAGSLGTTIQEVG